MSTLDVPRPLPSPYVQVAGLVAAMALIAVGNGLMATYVPVRLNAVGVESRAVGAVVTAYAVGMLLGCLLSGYLVRRSGHVRAFTTMAAMGTISALLLSIETGALSWGALRIAGGFCTTGMFMIAQSWLNAVTQSAWRGRVMALFYVSYTVGLAMGALALSRLDVGGDDALMLLAGCYAAALAPIGLTRLQQPDAPQRITVKLREVYRISPIGLVGAFVSGGLGMTMLGVGPLYGTEIGLAAAQVALLTAALQGGNLVIQWPLGALSDRLDRRLVILGASIGVAVVSIAIGAFGGTVSGALFWGLLALFAVWGGLAESIYTISTAHANDHAQADDVVMVSSTILIVWATGATLGPAVATVALEVAGVVGLWAFFLAEAALFAGFVLWRRGRRERPADADQEDFQAWPASSPPIPELSPLSETEGAVEAEDATGDATRGRP